MPYLIVVRMQLNLEMQNELDHISVGYVQKTDQKQTKIVLSAGMKTFEISILVNCKSDVNETCPRYAPPEHL